MSLLFEFQLDVHRKVPRRDMDLCELEIKLELETGNHTIGSILPYDLNKYSIYVHSESHKAQFRFIVYCLDYGFKCH